MRSNPVAYRLTFLLPRVSPAPASGERLPDARGCTLSVHRAGLVQICGASREAVFDRGAEFIRDELGGSPRPFSIAAVLAGPSGRDAWSIIIGADVAFSPTSLPPIVSDRPARAPPVLQLVVDGVKDLGDDLGDSQKREPAGA